MKKELRIPSNYHYLRDVDLFVEDLLDFCAVSDTLSGFINLSICESVNNAIRHGNKHDENKWVRITAEVIDKCLVVEVEDEGQGFNFEELPDPTTPERIKKEGGRGLFIISNLVDQVSFKNNGSVIQLKFKLNREHQFLL